MSKATDGAARKGFEAAKAGKRLCDNPYPDTRTTRGAITWSRAFRRAWSAGWRAGMLQL